MVFNVLVFFEFTKLLAIEQIFFWFTGLFVDSAAWRAGGWRMWRLSVLCYVEVYVLYYVEGYVIDLCGTFGAPCKALSINNIAIFRVNKIPTLKMA